MSLASLPTLKPQAVLATLARVAAMLLAFVGDTCPPSVDEHGLRVAISHVVTRLLRGETMEHVARRVVHLAWLAVGRTSAGDVRLPESRRRDRARVSRPVAQIRTSSKSCGTPGERRDGRAPPTSGGTRRRSSPGRPPIAGRSTGPPR